VGNPGLFGLRVGGFELGQAFLKPGRRLAQTGVAPLHVFDMLPRGITQDFSQVSIAVMETFTELTQVSLEGSDFVFGPLVHRWSTALSGLPSGHFGLTPQK
jgi:hypothetical protein